MDIFIYGTLDFVWYFLYIGVVRGYYTLIPQETYSGEGAMIYC